MAATFQDRLSISLILNGTDFPLDRDAIDFIHISESVRLHLPMLSMQFSDINKFLTTNSLLVDGVLVQVIITIENVTNNYSFRLFSHKQILTGQPRYLINGYLDSQTFWGTTVDKPKKGTTSSIISDIATNAGLDYDGVNTVDSQTWLGQNKKLCEYVMSLAQRGYVDDQSCMCLGVTASKVLRYLNLTKFNDFPIKGQYANALTPLDKPGISPITDYKILNKSGFFNNLSAYDSSRYETDTLAAGASDIHTQVNVIKNSRQLMVNKDTNSKVSRGTVSHAPIDVGNVHDKYERAYYQNVRLGNLFSYGLEVLIPKYVPASILDVVNCIITVPDVNAMAGPSGKYLITSKVIYIQGLNYYTKLELFRHGLNENVNTSTNAELE